MNNRKVKLSDAERRARHAAAQRRYYAANREAYLEYYSRNKKARTAAAARWKRENRERYLANEKRYNDTRRKGRP